MQARGQSHGPLFMGKEGLPQNGATALFALADLLGRSDAMRQCITCGTTPCCDTVLPATRLAIGYG